MTRAGLEPDTSAFSLLSSSLMKSDAPSSLPLSLLWLR
jgi:hypothetical protein